MESTRGRLNKRRNRGFSHLSEVSAPLVLSECLFLCIFCLFLDLSVSILSLFLRSTTSHRGKIVSGLGDGLRNANALSVREPAKQIHVRGVVGTGVVSLKKKREEN